MVNVNLLKSYMVKAGYTQKMLAQELGISEQTLTRKLKKRVFGTDEASKIVELLSIDNPQAADVGQLGRRETQRAQRIQLLVQVRQQLGQRVLGLVAADEGVLGLRLRIAVQHGLPHRELVEVCVQQAGDDGGGRWHGEIETVE